MRKHSGRKSNRLQYWSRKCALWTIFQDVLKIDPMITRIGLAIAQDQYIAAGGK